MKNKVQLIAYVDRAGGGNLRDFAGLLAGPLQGVFGAVHLLPFFDPIDGADAGFDPIDHTTVDPRLGDWSDVASLSQQIDIMADVIVNHISDRSPQFQDWYQRGSASPYDGMFLTRDAVYPQGATAADLAMIYRPRPSQPFREITLASGEQRTLWTTFTPHQIDIDVTHAQGRAYLKRILATLAANGVSMVRLDAVGYAIKKAGTSCFMLPETFDFIRAFAAEARAASVEVLVEVHSYYRRQIEIAAHVDWVYDFALPPLVLHAFAFATAGRLKDWIRIRPRNAITVLDTTDSAIVRLIVDDPDKARELMINNDFPYTESSVLAVEIEEESELKGVLGALVEAEINIHYIYSFIKRPSGRTALAINVEDSEVAAQALGQRGFKVVTQSDISR